MVLFSAQDVIKDYAAHRALDKVSISVDEGQVHGLLGPNGAGKTTLIRIINQITAPDQGKLLFEGRPMRASDVHQIGYLPEERGLYKKMKVGEQALYFAQLKGLSRRDALKSLKVWFEKFEIQGWWNKKVEELSKGMQQKVQFIITVVHKPKLLIFDEPFSGFDPINTNLLKQEMLNFRKEGSTIIFSTHNMASVEEICDYISLINKSKKIVDGPIHELKERYKNHEYEIRYKGETSDFAKLLETDFRIIEHRQAERNNILKVQHLNGKSNNELLQKLMQQIEIVSFQEIIPSMNEVFIKVVEQANQK